MKSKNKILIILMVFLLLALNLAGCTKKGDDPGSETTPSGNTGNNTNNGGEEDDGYIMSDLPVDELDYGKTEVTVLARIYSEMPEPMFFEYSTDMDIVDESIWKTTIKVEEDLGVMLNLITHDGSNLLAEVEANVLADTNEYSLFSTDLRSQGMFMCAGLLYDLHSIDGSYIGYDKPWWPASLIDNVQIGDRLYMMGGDISSSYLYSIWAMFYNTDMAARYDLGSITDLVLNEEWTLEKFMELTQNIRTEEEGTDPNIGSWGFTCAGYDLDAFWFGSGFTCFEYSDTEDKVILAPDFFSETAVDLIDDLTALLDSPDVFCERDTDGHYADATRRDRPIFTKGSALFHLDSLTYAKLLQAEETNFKWGVLPMPKYEASQDGYLSTVRPGLSRMWSMVSNVTPDEAKMLSAVLEDFGSIAYRTITPAVFEVCMKLKYSQDSVHSEMFDLIRANVVFDLGQSTSYSFGGAYIFQLPGKAMMHKLNWRTRGAIMKDSISAQIDEVFNNSDLF